MNEQKLPTTTQTTTLTPTLKTDENILVIKRDILFKNGAFQGLKQTNLDNYRDLIRAHQEYLPRSLMESDYNYKQIIPYLIFTHENRYFLMQRHAKATETRLQNKFSLGIGGHIYQKDLQSKTMPIENSLPNSVPQTNTTIHTNSITDDIYAWAEREFHEEIAYAGFFTRIEPIGILNDDSNDVGRVHVGLILLLHGDSPSINIKSELASGRLVSLDECSAYKAHLESWSSIVYDYLLIR